MNINGVYVVTKATPHTRQISLEEFLFSKDIENKIGSEVNSKALVSCTRTWFCKSASKAVKERLNKLYDYEHMVFLLWRFNNKHAELFERDAASMYRQAYIPKRSGGLRRIDIPCDELMAALRELKVLLEADFGALYHTTAFAYIKHRSIVDSIKRHQANDSMWFAKEDLHNFFGSTTLEWAMKMLSVIEPFAGIIRTTAKFDTADGTVECVGEHELAKAISLGFLNGSLPQGTPLSPTLTNILMIPIDHQLSNGLKSINQGRLVYTRYADDFLISSKFKFDPNAVQDYFRKTFEFFEAPFGLNESKSRFGSRAGRNWNLGLMLNANNEITVGHKNVKRFESMTYNFLRDKKNGIAWGIEDLQTMNGLYSYYKMVMGESFERKVNAVGRKFGVYGAVIDIVRKDMTSI